MCAGAGFGPQTAYNRLVKPARLRASPLAVALLTLVLAACQAGSSTPAGPILTYSPQATTAAGLVAEGDERLAQSDFAGAESAYRKAIEAEANFAPAHSHLSYAHLFRSATRQSALDEAQHAVDLAPDDASAWAYLARARDWNGNFEEARQAGEQAVKLDPNNADAQSFLGEIYTDLRMYAEAEKAAEQAVKLDPNNAEAHRNLGYYYSDAGHPEEALAEWQAAYDLQPKFVHRLTAIAIYYLSLRPDTPTARQWISDALALAPDDSTALRLMARLDAGAGKLEAAKADCQRIISDAPDSPDGQNCLGEVYAQVADWNSAETARQAAIKADPNDDSGYLGLGYAYYASGQCRQAETQFQKVIDLSPRSGQGYSALGLAQLCANDAAAAIESYQKAIELEPYNGDHHVGLGQIYLQQGKFSQAEREMKKAIELDPKSDAYAIWLGRVYAAQGDTQKAIEQYQQAVSLNPKEGDDTVALAFAHLQNGDFEQAVTEFQQALDQYEAQDAPAASRAEAEYGLGLAYVAQNDCNSAVPAFQEALRQNPGLSGVQDYLIACRRSTGLAENPLPPDLTASGPLGREGATVLLGQALASIGVPGRASFEQVSGHMVLVILYGPSVQPADPGFAAEQSPVVYAGSWALARLSPPVDGLLVVAIAPDGTNLSTVQVNYEYALWWTQGLITDEAFAGLWRQISNQ
jgi:tetratricopeptide (TPR) repeat protein